MNLRIDAARIGMVLAAVALVAAFFLPWSSADDEYREAAEKFPDIAYSEPLGLTVSDMEDVSLFDWVRIYAQSDALGAGVYVIYAPIIGAVGALSVLALLLSIFNKPVGALVFGLLCAAGAMMLRWDFSDRGVLADTHVLGIAFGVYVGAAVLLGIACIAQFVIKRKQKAA